MTKIKLNSLVEDHQDRVGDMFSLEGSSAIFIICSYWKDRVPMFSLISLASGSAWGWKSHDNISDVFDGNRDEFTKLKPGESFTVEIE